MSQTIPAYSLELDTEDACLYGVIAAAEGGTVPEHGGMPVLRERLEALGYTDLFFPTDALSLFLKNLDKAKPGRYLLAERRDASIAIEIARDKKSVKLKYQAAMGGSTITESQVCEQLLQRGVAEQTIDHAAIAKLLKENKETTAVVAKAINPVNGSDAIFKALVKSQTAKDHDLESLQAIDMHDLFEFTTVAIDQPLMQKKPPTKGEDGMDVCGKVLSAKPGKDAKFDRKHEGAKLSEDGLTLVAEIEGYPIIGGKSVKVDPVLSVKAVDLNTGHIDFKGTLFVQREIASRYDIHVTGDVIVGGSVVKTNIHAGGSVRIKGGIHSEGDESCTIVAGGDLSARFLNQVHAECGGNLDVDEYILQSEVQAHGFVRAGSTRGKGAIIGGRIESHRGVNAVCLGSDAYIKTQIRLVNDENAVLAAHKLQSIIQKRRDEERQIKAILAKTEAATETPKMGELEFDKTEKIKATLNLLAEKIEQLELAYQKLSDGNVSAELLSVNARKKIYPNVQVLIKGHLWHCEHVLGPSTIKYHDELVIAGDYCEPPKDEQDKE